MNADMLLIIFFKLINFAVLIGIMLYVWRRFGKEFVMVEFKKGHAYLVSLTQAYTLLRKEDRSIKKRYNDDEQERAELKERLFAWRDAIQKEQQELDVQKKERVCVLQERMKEQLHRVQEYRLYRQIQKDAISEVRDRLSTQYSSSDAQEQLIESIIKRLDAA